jgi:hypothetical protein
MKKFIVENKVFIAGLLAAVTIFIEQAVTNQERDLKAIGIGVAMVVLGYVGNNLKLKNLSITGIIGSLAVVLSTVITGGKIDWTMFILLISVKLLTAATTSVAEAN